MPLPVAYRPQQHCTQLMLSEQDAHPDGDVGGSRDDDRLLGLGVCGIGQRDLGGVANVGEHVGQEQVLGVEGDVQQEPAGAGAEQDPEVAVPEDGGVGQVVIRD